MLSRTALPASIRRSKRGLTQSSTGASSIRSLVHRQRRFSLPTMIAGVTALEMVLGDGVLTPAQIEKATIVGVKIKEARARTRPARGSRSARIWV
jgi:hypothetical protein